MLIPWGTKLMEYALSCFTPLIKLYQRYYDPIVKQEVSIAEITETDRVLCIGGGSVPCTAILIATLTGAKVKVIDIDERAIKRSRAVIKRLQLTDKIIIEQASGESVQLQDVTVVHLAVQLHLKDQIVNHIWSQALADTKIIVRMPKDALQGFYSGFDPRELPHQFYKYESTKNNMKGMMLLVKTANSIFSDRSFS